MFSSKKANSTLNKKGKTYFVNFPLFKNAYFINDYALRASRGRVHHVHIQLPAPVVHDHVLHAHQRAPMEWFRHGHDRVRDRCNTRGSVEKNLPRAV